MLNCSASGKKRGGGYHVRMAQGQCGFTALLRPLFFLNLSCSCSLNLLNCKHRIGFAARLAGHWSNGHFKKPSSSSGRTKIKFPTIGNICPLAASLKFHTVNGRHKQKMFWLFVNFKTIFTFDRWRPYTKKNRTAPMNRTFIN